MSGSRGPATSAAVEVKARGHVPVAAVRYARVKVARVTHYAGRPVLSSRVVLTPVEDPHGLPGVRAEATLDVGGTLVRAQAVSSDVYSAVDNLQDRLRRNLLQHQDRLRSRRRWTGVASDSTWRRGTLPTQRRRRFPRPVEEREIVRRKTFSLEATSDEEAAYAMDLLDHDFFLFTDALTGEEAVVYRDGDHHHETGGAEAAPLPVQHAATAPRLHEQEAVTRLNLSGEPFVFYVDPDEGRGRVMYHRHDGHYGLITPGDG